MPDPRTAAWYERAATRDLLGHSAVHVAWAAGVAGDAEVLERIERLPLPQRQPSLLFSLAGWLGAPGGADYPAFRDWLLEAWPRLEAAAPGRTTQTNEVMRCAPLLAALDRIPGDLALLEIGASAGLCLLPDRYGIRFDGAAPLGPGEPRLDCTTTGVGRAPLASPRIVHRAGVDLHPLDVADQDDRRWLEALLPPDRADRLGRLRAAIGTARDARTSGEVAVALREGDALAALPALLDEAPAGAVPVVVSLGTLVYLPPADREAVVRIARERGARLVTLEGRGVLPEVATRAAALDCPEPSGYLLALDGIPLACASPHGDRISWLS
ncbi:DUF2332 domain-containing protein [Homoserinibacter sp. YIM 151385]|uniref:DUF2332 domain-containing protein n=1 Tax=Homoserinibacter sp. YIM 151385 TaxID=2985506 RepID=UPI0022F06A40|nr:DUF2332 domain-containing protein [Homoserinibacter sp. YIM 151385]WBU37851.1 DUF2332 domain-containing protein [Homoserinibacter sp. YIM 151385]